MRPLLLPLHLAALLAVASRSSPGLAQTSSRANVEAPISPVHLSIEPNPRAARWAFVLTNRGDAAVDVAIDRNLLGLELTLPSTFSASQRRAPRAARVCRSALFRAVTEDAPRLRLEPGQSYREGFDLRALCGLRPPRAWSTEAVAVFTYGARGRRPSFRRAVVFWEQQSPIEELRAEPMTLTQELVATAVAPPPTVDASSAIRIGTPIQVSADRPAGIALRAALRARGPAPERAFFRPSMISVELITPRGARHFCSDAPRGYVGLDDYLRTFTPRSGPTITVSLGLLCGESPLAEAGIYLARLWFRSDVDPVGRGTPSFRGQVSSSWFWVHVRRGVALQRFGPLDERDPFGSAARSS